MSPALEVRDLRKRYGRTCAVDGLSLRAGRGQVTALLGPNGAGKTTTVQVCAGLRRPDGGSVRVLGADPWREGRRLRPRVGVMPQDGGAYPGATPRELLRLFAAFAAHPLDPAALLERVGLGAAAGTPYRRLSGGERQRLSLALAIVGRPELVFLDEPTAGLDVHARRSTWELVGQLRTDGVGVLLTTHYLEEAERLADHVVIVDRGRVVASGTPQEVTAAGASGVRFRLAPGTPPVSPDALSAVLGRRVTGAPGEPGTYLVAGPAEPALLAALTRWCAEHDVLLAELRSGPANLEETFVALTAGRARP